MRFSIKKIHLEINYFFVAVVTIMLISFPDGNGLWCFLLCIIHEIGHLVAMFLLGEIPRKIELGYYGMKIETNIRLLPPLKEIFILSVGPLTNIMCAFLFLALQKKSQALISLGLAVFNLLPAPILDGGRILNVIFPDSKKVEFINFVICIILFITGIAVLIYSKKNFSILLVSVYLLAGLLFNR